MKPLIVLPQHIDVVIASFGGVGTTAMLQHIAQFKRTNHPFDTDGFKHSPLPPLTNRSDVRFVYLYDDPRLAALSLFRRQFQYGHSQKLQRFQQNPIGPIPSEQTLAQYMAIGVDRFNFQNHFENWFSRYQTQQTLFMRFDALHTHLDRLADFLELPKVALETFPPRHTRHSSLHNIDESIRLQLDAMLGPFAARLGQLKAAEIKPAVSASKRSACYHLPIYQRALTDFVLRHRTT